MLRLKQIADCYGEAVFGFALAKGELSLWESFFERLKKIMEIPVLAHFLQNPLVDASAKSDVLGRVLAGGMDEHQQFLLKLVFEKKRQACLVSICDAFRAHLDAHRNLVRARVFTARALSAEQMASLKQVLEKRFAQSFELQQHKEPSLISGIRIEAGDRVMDASFAKALELFERRIQANV